MRAQRERIRSAVCALGTGFLTHPANGALRDAAATTTAARALHTALLRLTHRVMALGLIEQRGLLHPPEATSAARRGYAALRAQWCGTAPTGDSASGGTTSDGDGAYRSLTTVLAALGTGQGHSGLGLAPLGGLFDRSPQDAPLDGLRLSDAVLRPVLRDLLAPPPVPLSAPAENAQAPEGAPTAPPLGIATAADVLGGSYETVLGLVPRCDPSAGTFTLVEAVGSTRKTSGAYYTPGVLVDCVLDTVLEPVLDAAVARATDTAPTEQEPPAGAAPRGAPAVRGASEDGPVANELLRLTVCDPSCGSGRFLLAAGERIAVRVAAARTGLPEPPVHAVRQALADVVDRCLYGVDLDPMAVELASLALWLAAGDASRPVSAAHLRHGDALIGAVAAVPGPHTAPDTWCAAVLAGHPDGAPRGARFAPPPAPPPGAERAWFHWHLEFPEVFARSRRDGAPPGFDCVVGNPPWERVKLQEQEFFAARDASIATAARAADRKRLIAGLLADPEHPPLAAEYAAARERSEATSRFLRTSGRFPLSGRGDLNTYAVFVEAAQGLINQRGRVGLLVPTGVATDATTRHLFHDLVRGGALAALYDFENRRGLFPDVDSRFKFCLLALTGSAVSRAPGAEFAFFLQHPSELHDVKRRFTLTAEEIGRLNPNTLTSPVFRTRQDADITLGVYRRVPVLSRDPDPTPAGTAGQPTPGPGRTAPRRPSQRDPWGAELLRMFDMTHDSHRFHTSASLEAAGWRRDGGLHRAGASVALPLYEAKLAHHFDHRWATFTDVDGVRTLSAAEKTDPRLTPRPRYWVTEDEVRAALPDALADAPPPWLLGLRTICRSTDERSVIAAPLPLTAVGNSLALLTVRAPAVAQAALLAMVSSFVFDYVARQKTGGTNLNHFIVRQLPFLTPRTLARHEEFTTPRVLELVYTAHDMAPFARSLGYQGPPFRWCEDRRALLRAELDALFLQLYGVGRADARHVLDSFPLVARGDLRLHGHARTRDLVLDAYDRRPHRPGFRSRLSPPPGAPSEPDGG